MQYRNIFQSLINAVKGLLLIIVLLSSCKKFVEISPPINPIPSAVVFKNDSTALRAITGIYSEMMNPGTQFTASSTTFYAGMCADELYYYSRNTSKDEFVNNNITQTNHGFISSSFWDRAYRFIYTANLSIEGLNASDGINPSILRLAVYINLDRKSTRLNS